MKDTSLYMDIRFRAGLFLLTVVFLQWIFQFPGWLEWVVAIPLISFLGISHGAIDHIIAGHTQKKNVSTGRIILNYLLVIAAYGLVWLIAPAIAVLIFLLLSAYHFGEAEMHDLLDSKSNIAKLTLFSAWGIVILGVLFISHVTPSARIFSQIAPNIDFSTWIPYLTTITIVAYLITMVVFLVTGIRAKHKSDLVQVAVRVIGLHVLLALFATSSLILSFALFFGLWHALPVLREEYAFLSDKVDNLSWQKFSMMLAPFTIVSLFGIALLGGVITIWGAGEAWIMAAVVGVSVLTLPHALVMRSMYGQEGAA